MPHTRYILLPEAPAWLVCFGKTAAGRCAWNDPKSMCLDIFIFYVTAVCSLGHYVWKYMEAAYGSNPASSMELCFHGQEGETFTGN